MANANQVIVNGETILDLRSDTVTPATLKKGETAHDASGAAIVGTMESAAPNLQSKIIFYTSSGMYKIKPDAGYDGLSFVDVNVDIGGEITLTVKNIDGNIQNPIIVSNAVASEFMEITSDGEYTIPANSIIVITSNFNDFIATGFVGNPIDGANYELFEAGFLLAGSNDVELRLM